MLRHIFFACHFGLKHKIAVVLSQLTLVLLLTACGSTHHTAPVMDYSEGAGSTYKVRPGDTLYAISWRYGFDYRELAKTNNISPPYRLMPGQTLLLQKPGQVTANQYVSPVRPNQQSKRQNGSRSQQASNGVQQSAQTGGLSNDTSTDTTVTKAFSGRWNWPANGPLLKRYTTSGTPHKGIDIGGKLGDSVYAAAAGEVVYAGSGLVGYGNLVILRHDDNYLSAYGHNRVLLVREGNVVKAGQRIAEMGDSGTNTVKLHFEIRYDGKPVDPVKYLPKR